MPCVFIWELLFPVLIIVLFSYLAGGLGESTHFPVGWPNEEGVANSTNANEEKVVMQSSTWATRSSDRYSFAKDILMPLHLRPKYKLALAAADAADVAKLQQFRASLSAQWFPRQLVPLVPCVSTHNPAGPIRDLAEDTYGPSAPLQPKRFGLQGCCERRSRCV